MSETDDAPGTGAIHDIGYRHYDGPRLGASYIRRSSPSRIVRTAKPAGQSGSGSSSPRHA